MSRQSEWVRSDWAKRLHFKKYDLRRLLTKSIVMDSYATITIRSKLHLTTAIKLTHYSLTEQRNRCRISGRSYFVLSRAGLARMPFKFMSGCGLLSGVSRRGK